MPYGENETVERYATGFRPQAANAIQTRTSGVDVFRAQAALRVGISNARMAEVSVAS
jgi:hypothetical protein